VLGGALTGGISDAYGGQDTLVASDLANAWQVTGLDAGDLVGVTSFAGIERLQGGSQADQFTVSLGGSTSGVFDGGGGSDTLTAPAQLINIFQLDLLDGGLLWSVGRFASIENLIGNAFSDIFWLTGGSLTGTIDGQAGLNTLQGDNISSNYVVDGADSGQATGIGGGFTLLGTLIGGNAADLFSVTAAGSVTGQLLGSAGDDSFVVTPAPATSLAVDGGAGLDELAVDAQAGLPFQLANTITVIPGGGTVTFGGFEEVTLLCDTCLPLPAVATPTTVDGTRGLRRGARIDDTPEIIQLAVANGVSVAALPADAASALDVGHFASSAGVKMGFADMARQQRRHEKQLSQRADRRQVDHAFLDDRTDWVYGA